MAGLGAAVGLGTSQPCGRTPRGWVCCVRGGESLCLGWEPPQTFWVPVCVARSLELVLR